MAKRIYTIREIAERCGVSPTSVSLILNNRANTISAKTREKVLRVAKEYDYVPNGIARSLAMKKSYTIGVIIPDISNNFFSESVKSIQIELDRYGYAMLLCNSEEKYADDIKFIKLLANRQIDGLILTMSAESLTNGNWLEIKELVESLKIPTVLYDRYYPGEEPKVFVDNVRGAYELTKHLIEKGHREIGMITGPTNVVSSRGRMEGALLALKEEGIVINEDFIYHATNYDVESGRRGAQALLGKVTAIFAFNDMQAYGVLEVARKQGVSVPEELSVVGFDDIFYSNVLDLPLTTVSQPIAEMSKALCGLLIKAIDGEPLEVSEISVQGQLVIRQSVGTIKRAK